MSDPTTTPITTFAASPRSRRRTLVMAAAALAGLGLTAAGAVHATSSDRDGWRSERRAERQARAERFCANDTVRYHPVVRAFVRADLRLDTAQAGRFEQLADLVLPGLEDLKREVCNDFVTRGGPVPERLTELAANLRKAADLAERAVEPSRQFYTSLSDEQRSRIDQLTDRRRSGGGGPR